MATPSQSARLALALAPFGVVAPTNNSGRGFDKYPDTDTPFVWTGAPVDEFRRTVYRNSSKRGLRRATNDADTIAALWSGDYATDGVAFKAAAGLVYVESDDRHGGALTLAQHGIDTATDWHPRRNGRGVLMRCGAAADGVKKAALGDGVEIFADEFVVMPPGMTADAVQVIDAHPAIVAALEAARTAKRQHKAQPVNLAPATPGATLPADRAKAYALATLANAIDAIRRAGPGNHYAAIMAQAFKVGRVLHLGLDRRAAYDALVNTITDAGVRHRNSDAKTIDAQLTAGALQPVTPTLGSNDTRAAFEAFGVSLWHQLHAMPTGGTMSTEDGRAVRRALVVSVMAALAELTQKRGIFGTVAASVRCVLEQRGRGNRADMGYALSAAVRAGWLRRVGRDTVKWLAKHGNLDKRLMANAFEFDVLAICAEKGTGKSDSKGGGVARAQRAAVAVGQVQAQPGAESVAPGGDSLPRSLITVPFSAQLARMLAAGFAAGEVEVLRAAAGGASTRGEIVAAVMAAGMSRRTAYSWIDAATAEGALTLANGCYTVNAVTVGRMVDEHLADARRVKRRSAIAQQNRRERDDYRADIEYVAAIEATGRAATLEERRERRARENAWLRSWHAEHGERPTPADVAAYRAGVIRDVLAVTMDSVEGRVDDGGTFGTPTDAQAFEVGTATGREMTVSTPTHTLQDRAAVVSAPVALAGRLRALRGVNRGGAPSIGVASVRAIGARVGWRVQMLMNQSRVTVA